MLLASPAAFMLVRSILGSWIANAEGRPSTMGLFVHALVFVLVSSFLFPAISGYSEDDAPAPSPGPEEVPRDYSNLFSSVLGDTGMNNFDN